MITPKIKRNKLKLFIQKLEKKFYIDVKFLHTWEMMVSHAFMINYLMTN